MTARFVSAEPQSRSATPDLVAIRAAAAATRDAEIARMVRGAAAAVVSAARWLFDTIADWQERNATYQRLRSMSDRELADIGLTRDQIARVFDPAVNEAPAAAPAAPAAPIPTPANDAVAAPARAA
jgi:uncharacterized protein YjiS (DUF1127 family)